MTPAGPDLPLALRTFLKCGLILDPCLAGLSEESFSFASQEALARAAAGLAGEHWREPLLAATLGTLPAARGLGRRAALEVLTCSAAAIAHERVGRITVDTSIAAEAVRRVEGFIAEQGFGPLVLVFLAITGAESQAAVAHYGQMSEEEFVSGALHRPWTRTPLDDELMLGLAVGHYRLVLHDGRRYVQATPEGRSMLAQTRALLAETGYLAERLRLTWVSHFNLRKDLDEYVAHVLVDAAAQRVAYTEFCRIAPGMTVLEVGCGAGTQLFAGGLWAAVGAEGSLVGLDPAVGMLAQARRKATEHGARNVRFVQGRAESLPFADGRFDAAVAIGVLEFTDAHRAVAEMARVVRPGGRVAVIGAHQGAFDLQAMRAWFHPVLALAERYGIPPGERTRVYGHLGEVLESAGLTAVETTSRSSTIVLSDPDFTVQGVVQGSDFALEVLERLPWAARQEVIGELVHRGRAVCAATPPGERTVAVRTDFARGVVPTPAGA